MTAEVALVAKLSQQDAVVVENEESMVACIGYSNAAVHVIDSYVVGVDHLTIIPSL